MLAARFGQARPRAREENWVSDAFAVSGTRRPRRTERRAPVASVECMQMARRTFLRGKPPTTQHAVRPRALQCQRAMHGRRWLSHPSPGNCDSRKKAIALGEADIEPELKRIAHRIAHRCISASPHLSDSSAFFVFRMVDVLPCRNASTCYK